MSTKPEIRNQRSETMIETARAALAPLARINPQGDARNIRSPEGESKTEFTGVYRIQRCRSSRTITGADISLAAKVHADPKATESDLRKAILPLARLPVDTRVEDDNRPIFVFPGVDGQPVTVTNGVIEAAQAALETLEAAL